MVLDWNREEGSQGQILFFFNIEAYFMTLNQSLGLKISYLVELCE